MAKQTYDIILSHVLEWEGGYTNDAADPGGPTNWGITIFDARMYWKSDATASDVKKMPLQVAKDIYRSKYWNAMSCDDMPPGVDYALFDYGVNSGISRSAKVVQRILGVPADGKIGLITLTAIHNADPAKLIRQVCDERLGFLQGLSIWPTYAKGWTRRVLGVKRDANAMIGKYPVPVLPPPVIAEVPTSVPASQAQVETGAKAPAPTPADENPLTTSKSIWGNILTFSAAQSGLAAGFFDKLNNPYTLAAFIFIVLVVCVGFYMVLKGRLDIQKVLKNEVTSK